MAEKDTTPKEGRAPGPELRLIDRRAFVGFPELTVAPGVVVHDFALQVPDVTFPMNISGGAAKYQKKKLDFGFLEVSIDAEVIGRKVHALAGKLADLDDIKLSFRPGTLELQARLRGPERAPLTLKIAFDGDGERLAVYLYDVRFYAFSTTPAARLGATISEAVRELDVLPDVERRGANGFTTRILPGLVELAAVSRGYKMPSLDQARLAEATISSKGVRLRFSSGGLPPPSTPDEELMLALEGSRAFADAEELLSQGKLSEARTAYLRLADETEAHPFAVERLLSLLVADPQAHELALDVAASLARRRDRSATAIWAEAVVRERRGEFARASERYLALSNLARKHQEESSAFFAAEAAARASRDHAPQMAVKALHELLGLKPDHLPSLKALARASDQAKDRAGAIRAYRRLAALARDPADAAEAHVQLARLCAETEDDLAGARLHCEAALRLAPDHPDALFQLGDLCYRSGEFLRAVKALDRLREVAMGRHEVDRIGRANVLAGMVWETGLKQPENALLRYREAISLLPGEPQPLALAARVAESLGKVQEAIAGYQQAVELAGPSPRDEKARKTAHDAHHALARLLKTKLGEPARAREHLEAALLLEPSDKLALDELLPYFRASGKTAELADACEKSAAVIDDPLRRAALWAEAGELYRGRLSQPDKAERLLTQALEADPKNRLALEGMLALAESRRDGGQLCRCLRALAELAEDPKDRVRHYRRLAVAARDLSFDLDLAVHAYREVLRVESDDLPVLGELTALERRRSDMAGLAWALEQRARAAEVHGDKRLAAAALRELGQVLDTRLGRAGDSLVALEKSARLFPDANTLLDLANLSLRLERAGNARRALEDVLALLPKHAPPEKIAEVRAKLGRAAELLGDKDGARENYAQAFPLRRLDDELAGRLEALYVDAHLTRELTDLWAARAQALLQAGRAHDAAPLFFKSAQTLLAAGDASGAILRLTAALDAAPTGDHAIASLEAMAQLEVDRGELNEAARLYARRAGLATEARVAARFLFRAATLTRDTAREQPFLAQALERDGSFIPARARRAELLETVHPREALADFEVILAADPKDEDVVSLGLDVTLLTRRTAFAALKAGQLDIARRLLAKFCALKPDDLEAQLELASLHRRAGALEPLVDLLGELWPRMSGAQRNTSRREFTEGALTLGRSEAAIDALRSMLAEEPTDDWAASKLLAILPMDSSANRERLELLTRLVVSAQGEPKAELLARRAELHRVEGDPLAARADLLDAAQVSGRPVPLLRALAELARQSRDDVAELAAWRLALERGGKDTTLQQDAQERLSTLAKGRAAASDHTHAIEAYEALVALPLGPVDRFEAWWGLAQSARALGRHKRAEEALLEASRQGSAQRRVEALLQRAALLEERAARDEAVTAFEAAIALAPKHPGAIDGLKRNLTALEDWEGLAEVLAAEVSTVPRATATALLTTLAALYLDRLNQLGPGEAALRRIITLDERAVDARRRLAGLLVDRGDLAEAVLLLDAASAHVGAHDAAQMLQEGAALAKRLGDGELELRLRRRANELVPASGESLAALADALYLHGAVREALPLQRQLAEAAAFDDAPDDAERVLLRLADLAEQLDERELAEATLRRVVQERPLNTGAVERLASILATRDRRGAIELLARHAEGWSRSRRTTDRLVSLARQAHADLDDVELAARLFSRAAEASDEPLVVRRELAKVLRDTGRVGELAHELVHIAQLELTDGNVDAALEAYLEESKLAEAAGRIDDALRTLTAMADISEDDGRDEAAAGLLVRVAELQRDSKLDLDAAESALGRAWSLQASVETARMAMALAHRRGDRDAEIDWLEKTFAGLKTSQEKSAGFVQLARLHLGLPATGAGRVHDAPMHAPDQAEAALRRALELHTGAPEAEALLLGLFERQDRVLDVAAYFEERATQTRDAGARAAMLLRAAHVYQASANRPAEAAAALLAARSANPDDIDLTSQVADQLHQLGRVQDAADFDALVLEANPFHPSFDRHRSVLTSTGDDQALAALLSRRAERETGRVAAERWLEAAAAFRRAGAVERAQLCETQAFEAAPDNVEAFNVLLERADDVRRRADLLSARARVVPGEARQLLKKRAQLLSDAHEALLAAAAWDDYLALIPDDLEALEVRADLAAAGGGTRAAQPYDRRLVQLGGATLSVALRLKTWLRLGAAALEASAWRDAVDAFEAAYALDADGPRGREALSFLSEAFSRLGDLDGQFRTTVRLARASSGAEAEALYRRAISLEPDAAKAVDAIDVLFAAHPADVELFEKSIEAHRALGRLGEVLRVYERHAEATGGAQAAKALLAAAEVLEKELHEPNRAFELLQQAVRVAPSDPTALQALLAEQRKRGDGAGLITTLRSLIADATSELTANPLRLELASALEAAGDEDGALQALQALREGGQASFGYAHALANIERLATKRGDFATAAQVQLAAAELLAPVERATRLLDAARAFRKAKDLARAESVARDALAARGSREGLLLLVELAREGTDNAKLGRALAQLAAESEGASKTKLMLECVDAWEAAGDTGAATETLERLLRETPGALGAEQAGERLSRLGAKSRALEVAFGPVMASRDFERALQLADEAHSTKHALEALWAMLSADASSKRGERLATELRQASDVTGLERLAALTADTSLGAKLYEELLFTHGAERAFGPLVKALGLDLVAAEALDRRDARVLTMVLPHARELEPSSLEGLLQTLGELVPERRRAALRELATLRVSLRKFAEAVESLATLASLEETPRARAALHIERGELLLHQLSDPTAARAAFERALVDDSQAVAAVRELVELYRGDDVARFVAMADRLAQLAGQESLAQYREPLAEAFEQTGRARDAYRLLAELPESPSVLTKRAALAQQLGLRGEALQLQEKVATEPAQLETILVGYLEVDLVPFAVRLAERLLSPDTLSAKTKRLLAERMAPYEQGATLASRVWPELLRANVADADGWTLYGEALRRLGRAEDAVIADGFGAALAASRSTRESTRARTLRHAPDLTRTVRVADAKPITPETMPRLSAALADMLAGFEVPASQVVLDPSGGAIAWRASAAQLVIGAGALATFGLPELSYAVALAWCLGDAGAQLRATGPIDGLTAAAVQAFDAVPASLAASRVLVALDEQVRGGDPRAADGAVLLPKSDAWRAVALHALAQLEQRERP